MPKKKKLVQAILQAMEDANIPTPGPEKPSKLFRVLYVGLRKMVEAIEEGKEVRASLKAKELERLYDLNADVRTILIRGTGAAPDTPVSTDGLATLAENLMRDLRKDRDEAERLLRLACRYVIGEGVGDKSLAFLRRGQSSELADLVIAIEETMQNLEYERQSKKQES